MGFPHLNKISAETVLALTETARKMSPFAFVATFQHFSQAAFMEEPVSSFLTSNRSDVEYLPPTSCLTSPESFPTFHFPCPLPESFKTFKGVSLRVKSPHLQHNAPLNYLFSKLSLSS